MEYLNPTEKYPMPSGNELTGRKLFLIVIIAAVALCALCAYAAEAAESYIPTVPLMPELNRKVGNYSPEWLQFKVLGVAAWQFMVSFFCILVGLVLKKVSDFVFDRKLIPLLEKTPYTFDKLLSTAGSKPFGWLLLLLGFCGAFAVLPLPVSPNVRGFVYATLKVLVASDMIWFLFRVVDVAHHYLMKLSSRTDSKLDDQLVPVMRKALKVSIAVIGFVWVVQLLGYSVTGLLAGLGVGGVAVALALQDTLGNFFGSIMIFIDRPFSMGDWIKIGDVEGIVEQIGFRSTRIRTWPATLVSIPNKTVASATIDNWSSMPKRRVKQVVGVTYDTTADQMEEAIAGIRSIINKDDGVDKDFIVVRFADFGDWSLNMVVCYFTIATDWDTHLATKERINLAIMRMLDGMGLSIAFPTTTVHLGGPAESRIGAESGADSQGDA